MSCENDMSQDPLYKHIVISAGDTYSFTLNFTSGGAEYDLTGATVAAVLTKDGETDVDLTVTIAGASAVCVLSSAQSGAMLSGDSQLDLDARWLLSVYFTTADNYTQRIIKADFYVID